MSLWKDTPSTKPILPWEALRVGGGQEVVLVISCSGWVGLETHFANNESQPCIGEGCKYCEHGNLSRWQGFTVIRQSQTKKPALFNFTAACVPTLFDVRARNTGGLWNQAFSFKRKGKKRNGRLECKWYGKGDYQSSFRVPIEDLMDRVPLVDYQRHFMSPETAEAHTFFLSKVGRWPPPCSPRVNARYRLHGIVDGDPCCSRLVVIGCPGAPPAPPRPDQNCHFFVIDSDLVTPTKLEFDSGIVGPDNYRTRMTAEAFSAMPVLGVPGCRVDFEWFQTGSLRKHGWWEHPASDSRLDYRLERF